MSEGGGRIQALLKMLEAGRGNALLHYSLGSEYLKQEAGEQAAEHLARAVSLDPEYSAAWREYARALLACAQPEQAMDAYRQGIQVARQRGDQQAAREMEVFLRRLERDRAQGKGEKPAQAAAGDPVSGADPPGDEPGA